MSCHPKPLLRVFAVVAAVAVVVAVSASVPPIVSVSANTPADASHQGDLTTVVSVGGVPMVVHEFTTPGTSTFTPPLGVSSIDYLVIGGGGGGGARYGGGGGGGGVANGTLVVTGGHAMAVTVGAGGAGGLQRATGVTQGPGMNGASSSLGLIERSGGGGGGAGNAGANTTGRAGASGGGGGGVINTSTVAAGGAATQGSAGGDGSYGIYTQDPNLAERYIGLVTGGGGGSTGVGGAGNHATRTAGAGGTGTSSSITGIPLGYGGGGGGGAYTSIHFPSHQIPGVGRDGGGDGTNTATTPTKAVRGGGGGGGGAPGEGLNGSGGGDGGDGLVIVRYPVSTTSLTLSSSDLQVVVNEPIKITLSVEPADATGKITLSSGAGQLGTCTLTPAGTGSCEIEVSALSVGTHVFNATYNGSVAYFTSTANSVTVQVTQLPTDSGPVDNGPTTTDVERTGSTATAPPPTSNASPTVTSTTLLAPKPFTGTGISSMVAGQSVRLTVGEMQLTVEPLQCAVSSCSVGLDASGYPTITLSQFGRVLISGSGFDPGTLAQVWAFSDPTFLGALLVTPDGSFAGEVEIGKLVSGEHTLQVHGLTTTGESRSSELGLRVLAAAQLPTTGAQSLGLLVVALILTLGGLGLWWRPRSRITD